MYCTTDDIEDRTVAAIDLLKDSYSTDSIEFTIELLLDVLVLLDLNKHNQEEKEACSMENTTNEVQAVMAEEVKEAPKAVEAKATEAKEAEEVKAEEAKVVEAPVVA